jgi:FkbM family methyltransferase
MNDPFSQIKSIDFLDVGCSGSLDRKWLDLQALLSYVGFDPNVEECNRLNNQAHSYKAARYFPYAIAGEKETKTLYMTESIYCYSLLPPNHEWLRRFSFSALFTEIGISSVVCTTLNDLSDEQKLTADIIKIDTQGLELPILQTSDKILSESFCVETETGFVENYIGETTYAQIDEFMRSKGFLMFDINIHRVSRKNSLSDYGEHQPLWCETIWLFDFIGQNKHPSMEKALKSLMICKSLKYFDYGMELARYFNDLGLINSTVVEYFERQGKYSAHQNSNSKTNKILNSLLKIVKLR